MNQEELDIKKLIFSFGLLLSLHAQGLTYINHFNSQFAGEIGLISLGLGKEFSRYSIGGMYGIVPSEISGGPLIETVTLRQTYKLFHWKRISVYTGLNIFHVLGIKYQTHDYGTAPDNYYPIGSIRGIMNLGISVAYNKKESKIFYVEAGMNDITIVNYINNSSVINPQDEVSLALGFKQRF
ncbi:MAG: hypothetical protein NDI69_11135 [Bacteriovoracaceae bacterium]|nr:hypothetical protein [Bacteriovoracaceae bacterium]